MLKKKYAAICILLCLIFSVMPFVAFANEVTPDVPSTDIPEDDLSSDLTKNDRLILTYTLNEDGTVQVNELWSIYCEGVPGVFETKIFAQDGVDISDIRVYDENATAYVRLFGNKDKNMVKDVFTQELSREEDIYTLKIYNQTTDDYFNINVSYVLKGSVVNYADASQFEYKIIDSRLFEEIIPEVTVNMVTHRNLEKFTDFKLSVYTDADYEITPVNKSQTNFSLNNMKPGDDVLVKLILPMDLFPGNTLTDPGYITGTGNYEKPEFFVITPGVWEIFTPSILFKIDLLMTVRNFPGGWAGIILMIFSPVLIIGAITLFAKRTSQKAKTKRPYSADFRKRYLKDLPDNMNYAEAARLMHLSKTKHMDEPKYFAAILLSLYGKGYVNILSTKRGIRIALTGKADEYHLKKYEQLFLIFLEEALGEDGWGNMGKISEYMFRNCDKVSALSESITATLDENLMNTGDLAFVSDNFIYNNVTSKLNRITLIVYVVIMMIFAGICNFMFIMGMGRGFLALGMLVLCGIALISLSTSSQKILTQKGEDTAARWDAFCRYLNEAERLISEEEMLSKDGHEKIFIYAAAFDVNKRALRHLNYILAWVGERNDLGETEESIRYAEGISNLLTFTDELEKMKSNCLKLYDSEKGPFYRQRSEKRIKAFMADAFDRDPVSVTAVAAAEADETDAEDEMIAQIPDEENNTDKAV